MKLQMTLNSKDIAEALARDLKAQGKVARDVRFSATAAGDCFDRPTGGYVISAVIEYDEIPPGQR